MRTAAAKLWLKEALTGCFSAKSCVCLFKPSGPSRPMRCACVCVAVLCASAVLLQAEQLSVGRLGPGALYNESVLYAPAAPLPAHLVARVPGTTVVCFELTSIKQALGAPGV